MKLGMVIVMILIYPVVIGLVGALGLVLINYIFDLGVDIGVGKSLAMGLLFYLMSSSTMRKG